MQISGEITLSVNDLERIYEHLYGHRYYGRNSNIKMVRAILDELSKLDFASTKGEKGEFLYQAPSGYNVLVKIDDEIELLFTEKTNLYLSVTDGKPSLRTAGSGVKFIYHSLRIVEVKRPQLYDVNL
jgi:hypothetical protein